MLSTWWLVNIHDSLKINDSLISKNLITNKSNPIIYKYLKTNFNTYQKILKYTIKDRKNVTFPKKFQRTKITYRKHGKPLTNI